MKVRQLATALLLLHVAACDPHESASRPHVVPMDTVDGTIVVRNGASGLWSDEEVWTIQEDFRIGAIEGDEWEQFGELSGVGIGPNGQIAAIDFQAQAVRMFSSNGEFIREVGGPGSGPGEFEGPLALGWDQGGQLWVVDGWNQRYSVFDSVGVFLASIGRPVTPRSLRQRLSFVGPAEFIDETGSRTPDGRSALALVRIDATGSVIDTFPPLVIPPLGGQDLTPFPTALSRFAPGLRYAVTAEGLVWFASTDELRLFQRRLGGDTLRVVETRHRDPRLTVSEQELIEGELRRFGRTPSEYRFGRQLVHSIHVLEDGHVLVPIGEASDSDASVVDVFDPLGRFLGSVPLPFSLDARVSPAFRGETMVAATRDEMDVQFIVRAVIRRDDPGP